MLSEIGEPIVFTMDTTDIVEKVKKLGFSNRENIGAGELNDKYLANSSNLKTNGYFNIIGFSI